MCLFAMDDCFGFLVVTRVLPRRRELPTSRVATCPVLLSDRSSDLAADLYGRLNCLCLVLLINLPFLAKLHAEQIHNPVRHTEHKVDDVNSIWVAIVMASGFHKGLCNKLMMYNQISLRSLLSRLHNHLMAVITSKSGRSKYLSQYAWSSPSLKGGGIFSLASVLTSFRPAPVAALK